jgi:hypothetical protein
MNCIYTGFNFAYSHSFQGQTFRGDLYISDDGSTLELRGINRRSAPSDKMAAYATYNQSDDTLMFFPENLVATKEYVPASVALHLKSSMPVNDVIFQGAEQIG